mgnify:CR=1 FL=1
MIAISMGGRSPLTRGRHKTLGLADDWDRSIPAHAGKTGRRCTHSRGGQVDPRSRGEDRAGAGRPVCRAGRSPLTRGRHAVGKVHGVLVGSIPAHAGKTSASTRSCAASRVDPRSRGEDTTRPGQRTRTLGRSPLTRGRRLGVLQRLGGVGSIPAHAGKTAQRRDCSSRQRVDPRSRGEDGAWRHRAASGCGRSPLTRGRRQRTQVQQQRSGSIPAHAGKTVAQQRIRGVQQVDPRSRGEDLSSITRSTIACGRSPLTRGRQRLGGREDDPAGSIPAHAGKTSRSAPSRACPRVDPRSRGEDSPV